MVKKDTKKHDLYLYQHLLYRLTLSVRHSSAKKSSPTTSLQKSIQEKHLALSTCTSSQESASLAKRTMTWTKAIDEGFEDYSDINPSSGPPTYLSSGTVVQKQHKEG